MAVEITPQMVKELRQKTDAGMLDCKKALQEADGDQVKAEKILKEKGLANAAKRADRSASEGKVFFATKGNKTVILEINCETDFVSKNDKFNEMGQIVGEKILDQNLTAANEEIENIIKEMVIVLKENMSLKRFTVVEAGDTKAVATYSHNDGQIGVLVEAAVSAGKGNDEQIATFLRDCAMHIAALNPMYLNRDKVDPAYVAEQEDILVKQTEALGKPADMAKNIAKGKLNKHLAEICFLDQGFVKEPSVTVAKKAEEVAKAAGSELVITNFISYRIGG